MSEEIATGGTPPALDPNMPQQPQQADKMPTFLKVLCILSFVGCGLGIIGGVYNYFTYSAMAAGGGMVDEMMDSMERLEDMQGGGAMMDMMESAFDFEAQATAALIQLLLCFVILAGVLLMWKRRKIGYFIYAPVNLAYGLVPLIIVGGMVGGIASIFGLVFIIAFIVMYGLNLKHMS